VTATVLRRLITLGLAEDGVLGAPEKNALSTPQPAAERLR
jgi:hypothetical protein